MDELLLFTIDEPFTALQTDGLLLTILIDELSPQHRWTSSYYLRLTSPSLHFKQTGSFLQFLLTSSPLNTDGRALTIYDLRALYCTSDRRAPSYYLRLTSPSLHFKQTGSFLQLLLTSSPFNTDGRALTICEPFTALQTDGLPPTVHSDESFTALQTDGLPPTIHSDKPFTTLQSDGLLRTILIDELSPQHRWTSSYYLRLTSPSLHSKQTGSFLQLLLTSSPLNIDGRALTICEPFTALQTDGLPPTIHSDEPFTALQTDGLPPIVYMDELLLVTWTSSYRSLPDELFLTALPDELLLFTWTSSYNSLPDKLFLTALPDELPSST